MKKNFLIILLLIISSFAISQIPNPPVLINPPNGSTGLNPNSVLLDWSDVTGALSYRVQVSLNSIFTAIVVDENTTDSQYSIQPGMLSSFTLYYWHVNVTTLGGTSNWSSIWNFTTGLGPPTAPLLFMPMNGATYVSIHPTFDWSAVIGATAYIIHVSKSPLFDSLVVCDTTPPPLGTITLEYSTTYYWRVCGMNSGGVGPWSSVFNFTTDMQLPSAPMQISPLNNSLNIPLTPFLDWSTVPSATSYRVQVSQNQNFNVLKVNATTSSSQYNVPSGLLSGNTLYYWRVNASNAGGTGSWSSVWSFTTLTQIGINQISSEIPSEYKLYNNYPNPFNPNTIIKFQIKDSRLVTLKGFDVLGKKIVTLVNEKLSPGIYEVSFDGSNLPSGIYFYSIRSGDFADTKRMLLVK